MQPLTYADADGRYVIKGHVAGTYEVQKYEPISQLIRHILRDQGPPVDVQVQGDVEHDFSSWVPIEDFLRE